MNFSEALKALMEGKTVRRDCWISTLLLKMKDDEIYYFDNSDGAFDYIELDTDGYALTSSDVLAADWRVINDV